MNKRGGYPRINRYHPYASGLVYAMVGGGAGSGVALDSSLYGNHAAISGATWVFNTELSRYALSFDGVDDYATASLNNKVQAVAFWLDNTMYYPYQLTMPNTAPGQFGGSYFQGSRSDNFLANWYVNGVVPSITTTPIVVWGLGTTPYGSFTGGGSGTVGTGSSWSYMTITAPGTSITNCQAFYTQQTSTLTAGNLYYLWFHAYSSVAKTNLNVTVRDWGSPYANIGPRFLIDTATGVRTYRIPFVASKTTSSWSVFFYGGANGTYTLYFGGNGGISVNAVSGVTLESGKMTHIVHTGVSTGTTVASSLNVGRHVGESTVYSQGKISDLLMWNRPLTESEITRLSIKSNGSYDGLIENDFRQRKYKQPPLPSRRRTFLIGAGF